MPFQAATPMNINNHQVSQNFYADGSVANYGWDYTSAEDGIDTRLDGVNLLFNSEQGLYTESNYFNINKATEMVEGNGIRKKNDYSQFEACMNASELQGKIGSIEGNELDDPSDNFFSIEIESLPSVHQEVFLVYEVKGLLDVASVTRSINDGSALGGYLIRKGDKWTSLKEKISPSELVLGSNQVFFNTSGNQDVGYWVRNVRLEYGYTSERQLVTYSQEKLFSVLGKIYLSGFILDEGICELIVDGKTYPVEKGCFEIITESKPKQKKLNIEYTGQSGQTYHDVLPITIDIMPTSKVSPIVPAGARKMLAVGENMESDATIDLEYACVEIPKGSLTQNLTVSVTGLRNADLPGIPADMVNVTRGYSGYRMLPHGKHFANEPARITLSFDPEKIPSGYSAKDVRTYYFNLQKKKWLPVDMDSLLSATQQIVSLTPHFTDFINGIIQVPESPETGQYTPTTITDIKAADPASGIVSVAPPTPNNMGSVNTSFPIKLPAGRAGMAPQLEVAYSSDAGNGWMGMGWDVTIPALTLDTRWGAPRFDRDNETEIYSLKGEMLVLQEGTEYTNPHHTWGIDRNTNTKRLFFTRKEASYDEIIRHGTYPDEYYWEVTDKMGNKSFYGGHPNFDSPDQINNNTVIRAGLTESPENDKTDGNITHWALYMTQDRNGNYVKYVYNNLYGLDMEGVPGDKGNEFYPDSIIYTLHDSLNESSGRYVVTFHRNNYTTNPQSNLQERNDIQVNAKSGALRVVKDLLTEVKIFFVQNDESTLIRAYRFDYKDPETLIFHKQLLERITEFDANMNAFYSNTFEYENKGEFENKIIRNNDFFWNTDVHASHEPDGLDGNLLLAGVFDKNDNASLLGSSLGSGIDGSLYIGAGFGITPTKMGTAGIFGSASTVNNTGLTALFDIDGDGLADKVFKKDNKIQYRKNHGLYGTEILFSDEPVIINTISNFSKSRSNSKSIGIQVNLVVASGSLTLNKTSTKTSTYLYDVNNDGLIDIVDKGLVKFNISDGEETKFSSDKRITKNPIETNELNNSLFENSLFASMEQLDDENPLHDFVLVWTAPKDGNVIIHGNAFLDPIFNDDYPLPEYGQPGIEDYDGVHLSIQKSHKNQGQETYDETVLKEGDIYPTFIIDDQNQEVRVNSTDVVMSLNSFQIEKGDRLYFRVQSKEEGTFDQVNWSPTVSYVVDVDPIDANDFHYFSSSASEGFIVSDLSIMHSSTGCHIINQFNIPVSGQPLSDDVTFCIESGELDEEGTFQVMESYYADYNHITNTLDNVFTGPTGDLPQLFDEETSFRFTVTSTSNVDWKAIQWKPEIISSDPSNPYTISANVHYNIYNHSVNPEAISRFDGLSTDIPVEIPLTITCPSNILDFGTVPRRFYVVVKNNNKRVLSKKIIQIGWVQTGNEWSLEVSGDETININNNITSSIFVEFYVMDHELSKFFDDGLITARAEVQQSGGNPDMPVYDIPQPGNNACSFNFISQVNDFPGMFYYSEECDPFYKIELPINGNPRIGNNHPLSIILYSYYPTGITSEAAHAAVWLDFNRNAAIDAGEFYKSSERDLLHSFNILIPSSTLPGPIKVRVKAGSAGAININNFFQNDNFDGNIRDFTVNMIKHYGSTNYVMTTDGYNIFGPNYKNWGQVVYNGGLVIKRGLIIEGEGEDGKIDTMEEKEAIDYDEQGIVQVEARYGFEQGGSIIAIDSKAFEEDYSELRGIQGDWTENQIVELLQQNGIGNTNSARYYVCNPDNNNQYWQGTDELSFHSANILSSTRFGEKNLNDLYIEPNQTAEETSACEQGVVKMRDLLVEGTGNSYSGSLILFNKNSSNSDNKTPFLYQDLNGDGYPDFVTNNYIQFTSNTGLWNEVIETGLGYPSTSETEVSGDGISSGTIPLSKTPGAYSGWPLTKPQKSSATASTGRGEGDSFSDVSWQDMNGDGLVDWIMKEGNKLMVRINLGYSFDEAKCWFVHSGLQFSSKDEYRNAGLGVSLFNGSFSAGLTASYSFAESLQSITDINGDGLPDLLLKFGDDYYYYLNLGNEISKDGHNLTRPISENESISEGINATGSYAFLLFGVKVVTSAGIGGEQNINRSINDIQDINGDGYPDLLKAGDNDGALTATLSNIGAVNLLKKVHTPLGGTWEVAYKREGNTFEMANSKWVMDRIVTFDAFIPDQNSGGSDDFTYSWTVSSFDYENPYHDRRERDFFGFEIVTINEHPMFNAPVSNPLPQIDEALATILRKSVQEYHNDNYYLKGALKSQSLRDADDNVWTRTVNVYGIFEPEKPIDEEATTPEDVDFGDDTYNISGLNYDQVKFGPGVIYETDVTYTKYICTDLDKSRLFVAPIATVNYFNEGGNEHNQITSVTWFSKYDQNGNVKGFKDYGQQSDDVYNVSINYAWLPNIDNAFGFPEKITITDSKNNKLREREAKYSPKPDGNLEKVTTRLSLYETTPVSMLYDDFGNLTRITHEDSKHPVDMSSFFYEYTYDSVVYTYPVKVNDAFGYSSESKYNYLFGVPVFTLDMNGQPMRTRIDNRGRLIEIAGPDELFREGLTGSNDPAWTLRFEYHGEQPVYDMLMEQNHSIDDENFTKVYTAEGSFMAKNPGSIAPENALYYAYTRHFDPEYRQNDDEVESLNQLFTVTLSDGFGQPIQVKKIIALHNQPVTGNQPSEISNSYAWLIPGKAKMDKYSRALETYHPTTQNIPILEEFTPVYVPEGASSYINSLDNNLPQITRQYDLLDRPGFVRQPGESEEVAFEYSTESLDGNRCLQTIVTNELGQISKELTDIRKRKVAQIQISDNNEVLTTRFYYNPIGELIEVKDTEDRSTKYLYDFGGRNTRIENPDNGVTLMTYDKAGNLTYKQNSVLKQQGKAIKYKYTFNRLNAIEYPDFPENNVTYYYGEAGNSEAANHNAVGRLWYQVDATGIQFFNYNRLGNITLNRRSVAVPGDRVYWFQTEWNYDTWNRVKSIKYPDEELVTYRYDRGGELYSISASKPGSEPAKDIISQLGYDKFGERVYLRMGNGTETQYTYEPDRRRLSNITVRNIGLPEWGSGENTPERMFLNLNYKYDAVSNIDTLYNLNVNIPGVDEIGGKSYFNYDYDMLNRLTQADGHYIGRHEFSANDEGFAHQEYDMQMAYDGKYRIINKVQHHNRKLSSQSDDFETGGDPVLKNTYQLDYATYGTDGFTVDGYSYSQPHALHVMNDFPAIEGCCDQGTDSRFKQRIFDYDANGNLTVESTAIFNTNDKFVNRINLWDEENRLRAVDHQPGGNNLRAISVYTYDATGERVLKHNIDQAAVYENAQKKGETLQNSFTLYPSGMVVARLDPEENRLTYTKHYYSGTQRLSSKIGTTTNLGEFLSEWTLTSNTNELPVNPVTLSQEQLRKAEEGLNSVFRKLFITATAETGAEASPTVATFTHAGNEPNAYYFHADHLGSTSAITDASGSLSQHVLYFAFGETFVEEHRNSINSPYLYNGKEYDEETGRYYYGARYYDPRISLWIGVDPLAEERSWMSPYNYCQNNPIVRIDPTGALDNPIYGEDSEFLGTDDLGIQGEAIIMNKNDFKQGMSHEDALSKGTLRSNLPMVYSQNFLDEIDNHHSNLPNRPDWDGYLTLEEANEWYRTGEGQPLFTDISKIDLGIYSLGEKYIGQTKTFNLLLNSSLNNGFVYGNITLKRYPNHQVRAFADRYDFEMHNPLNPLNWGRNAQTVIGSRIAGEGTPFEINIYGSTTLKPLFPWTK